MWSFSSSEDDKEVNKSDQAQGWSSPDEGSRPASWRGEGYEGPDAGGTPLLPQPCGPIQNTLSLLVSIHARDREGEGKDGDGKMLL